MADQNATIDEEHCGVLAEILNHLLLVTPTVGIFVNILLIYLCVEAGRRRGFGNCDHYTPYSLNCFVLNGAVASFITAVIQLFRAIGDNFFQQELTVLIMQSVQGSNVHYKRLSELVLFMSTLFGPYATAHFNYLLLINVQKLLYILRPLQYERLFNSRFRVGLACAAVWLFSFLWLPSIYISPSSGQEALMVETILIALLFVCPTCFGVVTAVVIATISIRWRRHDLRLLRQCTNQNLIDRPIESDGGDLRKVWRSFRGVFYALLFCMPYPIVRIAMFCYSKDQQAFVRNLSRCSNVYLILVVVNLSVAYLVGASFVVIRTQPEYRKRTYKIIKNIFCKSSGSRRAVKI